MPWPPWKKSEPAPKSPDEIRKLQIDLIEKATGVSRIAETIGNNDLIDRAIKDFKDGDIDHGLRILRIPTNEKRVEGIIAIKNQL